MAHIDSTLCRPNQHTTPLPLVKRLSRAVALWRQRRQLKALSAAALVDIGITRAEAMNEANRPIWDVPSHWRS